MIVRRAIERPTLGRLAVAEPVRTGDEIASLVAGSLGSRAFCRAELAGLLVILDFDPLKRNVTAIQEIANGVGVGRAGPPENGHANGRGR